ncbi:MAG: hypothetical protein ACLR3C_15395 [Eggerthella lenta]
MLGVSSSAALAAKLAALLALCLMAAAIAAALFCGALALAEPSLPDTAAVALATAGIGWAVCARTPSCGRRAALRSQRLHRDGDAHFIAALTLMGGLANGLVPARSAERSALGRPRSCRSRGLASGFASLGPVIAAGMGRRRRSSTLAAAYATVTCACTAITAVVLAVSTGGREPLENPRRGGE